MIRKFARQISSACAIAALLVSNPALAEDTEVAQAVSTTTETAGPAGPALWSVSDEDTTVYLFGTIHVLPPELKWIDEDISTALKASDTLVTEVDMASMTDATMGAIIQQTAILPAGTTLRSLLDDEQTKTYEAALAQIQIPPAAFDQFEPWYANLMMSLVPLIQQGYSPDSGVEEQLIAIAGEIDKGALETIEFQLGLFDALPQSNQIKLLVESAEKVGEVKETVDALVGEWLEGDAQGLAKLMNEELEDEAFAEALLYYRNRNWAEWIETRMDEPGTVFMAVGAGHLAGEKSVQDYLEERGLVVTRIQ